MQFSNLFLRKPVYGRVFHRIKFSSLNISFYFWIDQSHVVMLFTKNKNEENLNLKRKSKYQILSSFVKFYQVLK